MVFKKNLKYFLQKLQNALKWARSCCFRVEFFESTTYAQDEKRVKWGVLGKYVFK